MCQGQMRNRSGLTERPTKYENKFGLGHTVPPSPDETKSVCLRETGLRCLHAEEALNGTGAQGVN
jgi:hypothetical protein